MSDLDDLLGNDSSDNTSGTPKGGGLRAQLEAVLAERQALKEQLAQVQTAQRQRDLNDLFTKHSIPELARDFFPQDAELSDQTAQQFLEKYGALWGHQAPQAVTTPAEQVAAAAMQSVAGQAAPPPQAPMSQADYAAQFAKATNMTELRQMMEQLGTLGA